MKTAMQELIEFIENKQKYFIEKMPEQVGLINAFEISIAKATELLDKERQQIVDAGNNVNEYYGAKKFPNGFDIGLDYYQKTYKPNL